MQKHVDQDLAAIRARGLPVNCGELDEWYSTVPSAENAALVYTQSIALLEPQVDPKQIRPWTLLELPRRITPVEAALKTQVGEAVTLNTNALRLAHQAAELSRSRYPINLRDGYKTALPHLAGLRDLARLLEFQTFVQSGDGHRTEAAASLSASLALARSLQSEPVIVSQVVRCAIDGISCRSLERVINLNQLSDVELFSLSEQVEQNESTNSMLGGLIGERAGCIELLQLLQNDPAKVNQLTESNDAEEGSPFARIKPGLGWKALGFFVRDLEFYLSAMQAGIDVMALRPPRSLAAGGEFGAAAERAKSKFCVISSMMLPGLSKVPARDAEDHAALRTARTALAVERWRLAHNGELPESLAALVPRFLTAIPEDPFDGKPLRFKKPRIGYIVYSIGPNLQDDGGAERMPHSTKATREQRNRYDLTFIVER